MFAFEPGRRTVATFVKTDSPQIVEVLARCGLDYSVLDAEHAPFDRGTVDRMMTAAHAGGLPLMVRVPDPSDATILSMLDLGAAGLVVPHVDTPDQAREAIAAARYVGGRRGISLSSRAGGYGTLPLAEAIARGDRIPVLCQIESGAAVEAVEAIAAVPGVGGLFLGRLDLALSLGVASVTDPAVVAAVERTIAAARLRDLPVIVACAPGEVAEFAARGATSFVVATDQALLAGAARALPKLVEAL